MPEGGRGFDLGGGCQQFKGLRQELLRGIAMQCIGSSLLEDNFIQELGNEVYSASVQQGDHYDAPSRSVNNSKGFGVAGFSLALALKVHAKS